MVYKIHIWCIKYIYGVNTVVFADSDYENCSKEKRGEWDVYDQPVRGERKFGTTSGKDHLRFVAKFWHMPD